MIARDDYESLMIVFWAKALENTQNKASNTTEVAADLTEKPHQCVVVTKVRKTKITVRNIQAFSFCS